MTAHQHHPHTVNSPAGPRSGSDSVVIIGGGVVGAACAYFLQKAGRQVTIVERGAFGRGCSHANCGYISPSHVIPLCRPGAIQKTLKSIFNKDSAFRLKPRIDFALFRWLMRFAEKCNGRDMLETGHALNALLRSSAALYAELLPTELREAEWEREGMLFVFKTEQMFAEFAHVDALTREHYQVGAQRMNGQELTAFEPALLPGMAGAYYYDIDSHVRPDRLMSAWKRRLTEMGVHIQEHTPVAELVREAGRIRAARTTSHGDIEAADFVIAAGAWSPALASDLGCLLPIQPGKGYSLTMPRPKIVPQHPMILEEYHVAITPFASGYRIGSTMEFAGYDETFNRDRLGLLKRGAKEYLREPYCEPLEEEWFGFRPMSSDGLPMIGRTPNLSNAWVAAGHSMLGLSMATGTGRLLSELMNQQAPHVNPTPYRVDRF